MKNSNLIGVLRVLDKKELKKLHKFLQSPYFNENKKVLALFEYLMRFAPKYEAKGLDRKLVFKKIFPDKSYEKNSGLGLRRLISQLNRLVEQFIKQERLELEDNVLLPLINIQICDFYAERDLEKQYLKFVEQFKEKIGEEYPFWGWGIGYHTIQYRYCLAEYNFYSSRDLRKSGGFLVGGLNHLRCYNFLSQLQINCLLLSLKRVVRLEEFNVEKLDDLLQQVQKSEEWEVPFIQVYYHALTILRDSGSHESFEALKMLLLEYGEKLPIYELRQLYIYAINFCIANRKKGKDEYNTALFELFKVQLAKGIIYADGKLLPSYFRVIVTIAIEEKAFDWVDHFFKEHEHKILGDNPEQIFQFNLANFAFVRKDFNQARDLLLTFDFTNQELKLHAKRLLIKIYYETDEEDLLTSALAALKAYIYRDKKETLTQQERNKNFANFLSRIMNTAPGDTKRKERLRQSLEEETNIFEQKWLMELLERL